MLIMAFAFPVLFESYTAGIETQIKELHKFGREMRR
jgi:hypothetical protein